MNGRFAVLGNPVSHSLSPRIHEAFAAQCGLSIDYRAREVAEPDFEDAVGEFFRAGGRGLNITLPFKQRAIACASRAGEQARAAGSCNTLTREADGVRADNTDGSGLVRDLTENLGWQVRARQVLLIGAGGAARGILPALLSERPAEVLVVNRNPARADQLARAFSRSGNVKALALDGSAVSARPAALVIHATSAGFSGEAPFLERLAACLSAPQADCYDLSYGLGARAFARWSKQSAAARHSDGLGMLVEQAADSFAIWHGIRPQTGEVLAELRTQAGQPAGSR